ncbi:MAG TPA: HAD family phosphatase [Elusimicrobiota bacterium]|nr:HAD family phosphatase [Elusimicrobiota bacterium]
MKKRRPTPKTGRSGLLVVFDIGNVLLRFDMERAVRNFEKLSPGLGTRIAPFLRRPALSRRFERGKISGPALYRYLKKETGFRLSYPAFCLAFSDIFTPVRENLRLMKKISAARPVAVLSNTNSIHWRHIHAHYPAFRHVRWPYSSHLLGHMKPDPRIFYALSRRTGFPLGRMILIDDRPENVRGARRIGMAAVHYRGQPLHRHAALKTFQLRKDARR